MRWVSYVLADDRWSLQICFCNAGASLVANSFRNLGDTCAEWGLLKRCVGSSLNWLRFPPPPPLLQAPSRKTAFQLVPITDTKTSSELFQPQKAAFILFLGSIFPASIPVLSVLVTSAVGEPWADPHRPRALPLCAKQHVLAAAQVHVSERLILASPTDAAPPCPELAGTKGGEFV